MSYLVSPTDRELLKLSNGRGVSSTLPERYGADVLIVTQRGRFGIQRKKFPEDFFASLKDGRLMRELAQLAYVEYKLLVVEGRAYYDASGNLLSEGNSKWMRASLRNLLRSVKLKHGIDVEWSENIEDTVAIIAEIESYMGDKRHKSLLTRPKGSREKDEWGDSSKRDWARYFLQGFQGVGPDKAEAIFDNFGRVPLRWDVAEEEMLSVYGIGKKTVRSLYKMLEVD